MGDSKNLGDIDFMALLAEVHGSSPEDLRDSNMAKAINALEGAHRQAATALRNLHTEGLRRKRDLELQAGAAAIATAPAALQAQAAQTPNTSPPIAVESGEGAQLQMDHRTLTQIVRPNRGRG